MRGVGFFDREKFRVLVLSKKIDMWLSVGVGLQGRKFWGFPGGRIISSRTMVKKYQYSQELEGVWSVEKGWGRPVRKTSKSKRGEASCVAKGKEETNEPVAGEYD